jgi:hypothetical protein
MGRGFVRKLLIVGLLVLGGCYAYTPVAVSTLPRGTSVRVHLATPGDFRITQVTVNDVRVIDAEVIGFQDDTLALSAWWLESASGYEFPASGETVGVPGGQIGKIEKRRISVARTAGLAGAFAGVTSLLIAALDAVGVIGGGGGGGGSTQ